MKAYSKISEIRKILPKLKQSTIPGFSNNGQRLQVRYERFCLVNEYKKLDTIAAKHARLDLKIFTGNLDKVWITKNKDLVFSMLVLERIDSSTGKYAYRTFNLNRGRCRWLKVL